MPATNSETRYGWVAKSFHWIVAFGMIANIALGLLADWLPMGDASEIARKTTAFSIHKTLGLVVLFTAILRILWALSQPKPAPLHPERRAEHFAAEAAHWLLYGSIVLIPLSGWLHHAATEGFAPIWWPFGQSLPFVPKSEALASTFGSLHYILNLVLWVTLAAHVLGALKHHFLDRDRTLARMLPGRTEAGAPRRARAHALPAFAALAVWAVALGGAGAAGWFSPAPAGAGASELAEVESDWQVQEGSLSIAIVQNGQEVEGQFADWTAEIDFTEGVAPGVWGDVRVEVAIGSLSLGGVTQQAKGADFLAAEAHPTAVFAAEIHKVADGYEARGDLTIRENTVPVTLPFAMRLEGDRAEMEGRLTLDRRDFGVGENISDPGQLEFAVEVRVKLTALRGGAAPGPESSASEG
ncbi:cytochrome b/b6 domain-containing protein [Roseivivax sp.]